LHAASKPRISAREVALAVVRDVFGPQRRGAREALDYRARHGGLDERDRAFATGLSYGAIKMRRLLDWYLEPYVGSRPKPLPPAIEEILRLGTFQLRLMPGVETHAAVFESVGLAKKFGHRGTAGLVNAVLRRVAEDGREPEAARFERRNDFLAVRYSMPTWIANAWEERFGSERLEPILAGVDEPALISLRADRARLSREAALERLRAAGIPASPSDAVADVVNLDRGAPEGFIERFDDWMLQSESAVIPVEVLDPRPGETVLDLCSGRGNKTLAIASRMRDDGRITAVEIDPRKCEVARRAAADAGLTSVGVVQADATTFDAEPSDAVLLDAPCSGLGILGRQAEARWRKSPDDPSRLRRLQTALMARAAGAVRPGGRLVYSVCTTDPRECEDVVDDLLAAHADFKRSRDDVLVTPGIDRRDGFFVASLERRA
jgi:16S rRNA (cytosine967-C5)-methyltransferase